MKIVKEMNVLIVAYWVPTELFIITLGRKISAHAEARVPLVPYQHKYRTSNCTKCQHRYEYQYQLVPVSTSQYHQYQSVPVSTIRQEHLLNDKKLLLLGSGSVHINCYIASFKIEALRIALLLTGLPWCYCPEDPSHL